MIVPTMCIRVMRVFMRQSFVAMQVAVLDVGRHRPIMRVLVMRIVEMYSKRPVSTVIASA